MENAFVAKVKIFEREKGWFYVSVPMQLSKPLECLAERGLIAVSVKVGNSIWKTSLLPMGDGTHFIALPAKVRQKENISIGADINVSFETRLRKKQ